MPTKNKLTIGAALAVGILAATSAAQAANDNQSRNMGGYHVGPMGQCFGCGRDRFFAFRRGWYGYAYVPGWRYRHRYYR